MEIPESVAMEILSKLPVKSLLRFRCVCKHWCSSFQTSYFITKHLHNNLNNNSFKLLVVDKDDNCNISHVSTQGNLVVKDNIQLPYFEGLASYSHCNGLVCLDEYEMDHVAIWNPSTREYKVIPESTLPRPFAIFYSGFYFLGFGYDSNTNDYKIVRFVFVSSTEQSEDKWIQVELYSLKSNSWKEIPPPKEQPQEFNPVIYLNGFCYWEATNERFEKVLLSFDMATEKFSSLPLPNFGSPPPRTLQPLDFNGQLGALALHYTKMGDDNYYYSYLWVMINGSWTKQFRIDFFSGPVNRIWLMGFLRNDQILFKGSNHEFLLFDLATKEVKHLGVDDICGIRLTAYVESLVPINGRAED